MVEDGEDWVWIEIVKNLERDIDLDRKSKEKRKERRVKNLIEGEI